MTWPLERDYLNLKALSDDKSTSKKIIQTEFYIFI